MFNILILFFKWKPKTDEYVAGGDYSSMFGLIRDQIKELMDVCDAELIEKLHSPDYNDINGILEKLKVDKTKGRGDGLRHKNEKYDIALWSGTQVKKGNCQMVVLCVGLNTKLGQIITLLDTFFAS
ncbi:unnamed protein product [Adineta steineri]|uniref:Uncharacterized protein n=1 Tax=Adineta steineri TaxID=433720 RepID=A0A814ILR0_9BILA|nr:unnamed protein product [Adineta steineri]CAF1403568.1 unnamed protein product [Adineta steineri]